MRRLRDLVDATTSSINAVVCVVNVGNRLVAKLTICEEGTVWPDVLEDSGDPKK
jgi:hypothetical protein